MTKEEKEQKRLEAEEAKRKAAEEAVAREAEANAAKEQTAKRAEAEAAKKKAADDAAATEAAKEEAKRKAAEEAEAKRKSDEAARKAAPVDADKELSINERLTRFQVGGEPRTVRACRINRRFFIHTPEGKQDGDVGDWIVQFSDGRRVVVPNDAWQAKAPKAIDGLKRAV